MTKRDTVDILKRIVGGNSNSPKLLNFASSEFRRYVDLSKDVNLKNYELFSDVFDKFENLVLGLDFNGSYESQTRNILNFYQETSFPLFKLITKKFGNLWEDSVKIRIDAIEYIENFLKEIKINELLRDNSESFLFASIETRVKNLENSYGKVDAEKIIELANKIKLAEESLDSFDRRINKNTSDFLTLIADLKNKNISTINEIESSYKNNIESLKNAFEVDVSLKSAVRYWKQKEVYHKRLANKTLNISFIIIPIGIIISVIFIFMAFHFANSLGETLIDKNFKYIISALIMTIFIWLIRLLIKVWLSNLHLGNDAGERVVLVKTYLALLKDGGIPGDDDKKIVMNSLFRQASDGVVKDDGMPNPILNLITKNK